jgi:hypothetical protein
MQSSTLHNLTNFSLPQFIYIKEVEGSFEFFISDVALTRKQEYCYKIKMKRIIANNFQFHTKAHKNTTFEHLTSIGWLKSILTPELKAFLLLYGFNIPTVEDYVKKNTLFTLS